MQNYSKAIAALITSSIGMLTVIGVDVPSWTGPEWAGAVGAALNPILVYFLANKPAAGAL